MLIPYSFKLGPHQYFVHRQEFLRNCDKGRVYYPAAGLNGYVQIATHRAGKPRRHRDKVQSFWHETVHAILHDMRHDALRDDEVFVDAFAKRLTQIVYSAEL